MVKSDLLYHGYDDIVTNLSIYIGNPPLSFTLNIHPLYTPFIDIQFGVNRYRKTSFIQVELQGSIHTKLQGFL